MNDPFSLLVDTLSGKRLTTPTCWPARKIYRLIGNADVAVQASRRQTPVLLRPPLSLAALQREQR